MPKHGWKWRTEQLKHQDIELLLHERSFHVSAKTARWIYRNTDDEGIRILAMERMVEDPAASWSKPFLWRELAAHQDSPFGDWVIIALTRRSADPGDAERYLAFYENTAVHPHARGSALFALAAVLSESNWKGFVPMSSELLDTIRAVCQKAFTDQVSYVRAGACQIAEVLKEFKAEVQGLLEDHELAIPGMSLSVADIARETMEGFAIHSNESRSPLKA